MTTAINRPIEEVRAALGGTTASVVTREGLVLALHKASEGKTLLHALAVGILEDPVSRKAGATVVRELRRLVETASREAA